MAEKGFYRYKCDWYDEVANDTKVDTGFTFASSYHEAVEALENDYGDTIIQLSIYALEPSMCLTDGEIEEERKVGF